MVKKIQRTGLQSNYFECSGLQLTVRERLNNPWQFILSIIVSRDGRECLASHFRGPGNTIFLNLAKVRKNGKADLAFLCKNNEQ